MLPTEDGAHAPTPDPQPDSVHDPVERLHAQMDRLMRRYREERWRLWSQAHAPRLRPDEDGRY